jgi:hypothetical protein
MQREAEEQTQPTPPQDKLAEFVAGMEQVWTPAQVAKLKASGGDGYANGLGLLYSTIKRAGMTPEQLKDSHPGFKAALFRAANEIVTEHRKTLELYQRERYGEPNLMPRLLSARIAISKLSEKTGVDFLTPYMEIEESATRTRRDIIRLTRETLKQFGLPKRGMTLSHNQNAAVRDWLFEENPQAKQLLWDKLAAMGENIQKFAQAWHSILQTHAALEVREARWWEWYNEYQAQAPKIAKKQAQLAKTTDDTKKGKLLEQIENMKQAYTSLVPPNATADDMLAAMQAYEQGGESGLREHLRGQKWGTREYYFMSEMPTDKDFVEREMDITPEAEVEGVAPPRNIKAMTPEGTETRGSKAKARNVSSVADAIMHHWTRNAMYNATRGSINSLKSAIRMAASHGTALSSRGKTSDIRAMNEHVKNATERGVTDSAGMEYLLRPVKWFSNKWWRFYFPDPNNLLWWSFRQSLQLAAYGGATWTPRTFAETAKELVTMPAQNKAWSPELRDAMLRYPWRASQRGEISKLLTERDELATVGELKRPITMFLDKAGELSSIPDEFARKLTFASMFESARKAKLAFDKHGNFGRLIAELKLDGFPPAMTAQLLAMAQARDVNAFAEQYAIHQTDMVNFRYDTSSRASYEQSPNSRMIAGLSTFLRGTAELSYYKSVGSILRGTKYKNPSLIWRGFTGLLGLAFTAGLVQAMMEKLVGRSDYNLPMVVAWTPLSPGMSMMLDAFENGKKAWEATVGKDRDAKKALKAWVALLSSPANAIPILRTLMSVRETVKGEYGVTLGGLVSRKLGLEEGGFKHTERTDYQKLMHLLFGGFEEGTAAQPGGRPSFQSRPLPAQQTLPPRGR